MRRVGAWALAGVPGRAARGSLPLKGPRRCSPQLRPNALLGSCSGVPC